MLRVFRAYHLCTPRISAWDERCDVRRWGGLSALDDRRWNWRPESRLYPQTGISALRTVFCSLHSRSSDCDPCPLAFSVQRSALSLILDVTATSRLVRGTVILAGMRTTPTASVAGDAASGLAVWAWLRGGGEGEAVAPGEGRPARAGHSLNGSGRHAPIKKRP